MKLKGTHSVGAPDREHVRVALELEASADEVLVLHADACCENFHFMFDWYLNSLPEASGPV